MDAAGKFSRYQIRKELGIGGMATVYLAYDPDFGREVALKIIKRELLDDPLVRERFEREAKIVASLEHAAIVPVYDIGRDNEQLFFVMRYMAGGSLVERIQSKSLSLTQIGNILQRIASALDYAHEKGVIHRDLKPGNILFDERNNAYISDFGLAKLSHAATRLTSSGIIGTPTHMSPEQARGEAVDASSDIYSLGVILFEMLSGKTPYEATTPLGMAFKHAAEPVPNILTVKPDLPPQIRAVIEKVMAKDRDRRYSSGMELTNAFKAATSRPVTPLVSSTTPRRDIKASAEAITVPPSEPMLKRSFFSRFGRYSGFLAITLVAIALWGVPRLVTSLSDSTSTPRPATPTLASPALTAIPSATVVQPPTEMIPPTAPPFLSIGGANKIALTANNDIYLMDMDGSHLTQLTNTNQAKFDLQWLPGGNELLYGEGACVYKINAESTNADPQELVCFNDPKFEGFRLSPDGKQVAISIGRRLLVLPFELQTLSTAPSTFELKSLKNLCLNYTDVSVKSAQWSTDGQRLAVMYQSVVGQRLGDTIRVLQVDMQRCLDVDPFIADEFPARRFIPEGYEKFPLLPSYDWDGSERFLFNTFERNSGYGALYLYDMSTTAESKINPVDGVCCYRDATFSPDGTYILTVFQDVRSGANSVTQLYYISIAQIGTGEIFMPIKLPLRFFPDLRENILLALRPTGP